MTTDAGDGTGPGGHDGHDRTDVTSNDPTEPPRPGDPRSPGPRPGPVWRDVAWAGLAVVVVAVTVLQLGRLVLVAARDPDVVLSTGALVLAFVVTVVWLMTVFWVAVGSWRRTVWGCPFDHLRGAPPSRRCARHRVLDDAEVTGPPETDGSPGGR